MGLSFYGPSPPMGPPSYVYPPPYLAIIVEVGVEPDPAMACGLEVDQHGGLGIVLREEHIKLEAAVGIGCV